MANFTRQDRELYRWADEDGVLHEAEHFKTSLIQKPIREDKFIKVYYDAFLSILDRNPNVMSEFLIAIGKHMSADDSRRLQTICLNKYTKENIAHDLGKSVTRVEHLISECVKAQILVKIGKGRTATYAVSPFILSRAKSTEIEGLQLAYNAKLGQMQLAPTIKSKDIERTERQGYMLEGGQP